MAEKKYIDFINKLIQDTKEEQIRWRYLDSNQELCKQMGWMGRDTVITQMVGIFSGVNHSGAVFNSEKSFFSQIESTYIVLFVEDNNPASLFIIPSTFKSIIVLSADEYGDLITRLLNIVNNKFPSADKFIDDYLGGEYD